MGQDALRQTSKPGENEAEEEYTWENEGFKWLLYLLGNQRATSCSGMDT